MTEQLDLGDGALPKSWLERWSAKAQETLPTEWNDPVFPTVPRKAEITSKNKLTVEKALSHIRTEMKQEQRRE